jgi:hypothetical protein
MMQERSTSPFFCFLLLLACLNRLDVSASSAYDNTARTLATRLRDLYRKHGLTRIERHSEKGNRVLQQMLADHMSENARRLKEVLPPCNLPKIHAGIHAQMADRHFLSKFVKPRVPAVIHNAISPRSLQWFLDQKCLGTIPVTIAKADFKVQKVSVWMQEQPKKSNTHQN